MRVYKKGLTSIVFSALVLKKWQEIYRIDVCIKTVFKLAVRLECSLNTIKVRNFHTKLLGAEALKLGTFGPHYQLQVEN